MSFIKRYLFLIFTLLAAFLVYRWYAHKPSEVWRYIPNSASVVISSDLLQENPETDSLSNQYLDLPFVHQAKGTLTLMKWFNEDPDQIYTFLKGKTITYAFYPLTGGKMGIVMYLPVQNEIEKKWLENPKNSSLRVSTHNFQGHYITDISNEKSENLFSYLLKNNYLIISQYGVLIEDAIRFAESGKSKNLADNYEIIAEGEKGLSLFFHGKAGRNFVFQSPLNANVRGFFDLLPEPINFKLESRSSATQISLLSDETKVKDETYPTLVGNNEGTLFEATEYISQRTIHLIRLSARYADRFQSNYKKWLNSRRSILAGSKFEKKLAEAQKNFLGEIENEVILCLNENSENEHANKVLLIRYGDVQKARPFLEAIADDAGTLERFHGYPIYTIPINEWMEALFGPLFRGFQASYITYLDPYLVVGNSPLALQAYLNDYENHFTWKYSAHLDNTVFQKIEKAQLFLVSNINKVRATSANKKNALRTTYDDISSAIVGYEIDSKRAKINLNINFNAASKESGSLELLSEINFPGQRIAGFTVTANSLLGQSSLLISNHLNELVEYNSSNQYAGKVIARLNQPIQGRSFNADFLNIGRPQNIVSTASNLYVIDEDENGLITLLSDPAIEPIQSMYRMKHSRENGAHFVLKSPSQNLYAWHQVHQPPKRINPRTPLDDVLNPVISFSENENIQYLITQKNGKVVILDEQGQMKPGFPVDLLTRISGSFATQQIGNQLVLSGVTHQGMFVKIAPSGEIIERKQLLLPESGSVFRTLFDANLQDWILLRQTPTRAALLDKEGNEIFEIIGLRPNFKIQYHYFGSENRFITVVSGNMASIFDFNGNRVGDRPIPCDGMIDLTFHGVDRILNIFNQVTGKIQIWSIKLP